MSGDADAKHVRTVARVDPPCYVDETTGEVICSGELEKGSLTPGFEAALRQLLNDASAWSAMEPAAAKAALASATRAEGRVEQASAHASPPTASSAVVDLAVALVRSAFTAKIPDSCITARTTEMANAVLPQVQIEEKPPTVVLYGWSSFPVDVMGAYFAHRSDYKNVSKVYAMFKDPKPSC
jgi:hypothetical protein